MANGHFRVPVFLCHLITVGRIRHRDHRHRFRSRGDGRRGSVRLHLSGLSGSYSVTGTSEQEGQGAAGARVPDSLRDLLPGRTRNRDPVMFNNDFPPRNRNLAIPESGSIRSRSIRLGIDGHERPVRIIRVSVEDGIPRVIVHIFNVLP